MIWSFIRKMLKKKDLRSKVSKPEIYDKICSGEPVSFEDALRTIGEIEDRNEWLECETLTGDKFEINWQTGERRNYCGQRIRRNN